MKVLVDTTVLLSAVLRDRLPEKVILHIGARDEWTWVVTPEILDEYIEVLRRPKFALPAEVLQRWSELVQSRTICVSSPPQVEFLRDPKDAPFLAAAIASSAEYLITGDRDLLQAQSLVSTRIVTVADMARVLQID
jgi:putative PIN family toxin of toxin-antitoxin system